jgi:2-polyprenyl-3-methyl-5-hydroxy-6-metoxy-1,4-benzoquinol methylase
MTPIKLAAIAAGALVLGSGAALYYGFGAFLPWREEREARRLASVAGIREGQSVAEIGAGGGRFSLSLSRTVGPRGRVFATELEEAAVAAIAAKAAAAGLGNVTAIKAGRLQTRLPDGCCDVVLLRNVYHHVTDPVAFARALRKAVRDGGALVVVDFETGALWFHGGRPDDAAARRPGHGVSRAAAIKEITAAGFVVEKEFPDWSRPMWLTVFRAVRSSAKTSPARRCAARAAG